MNDLKEYLPLLAICVVAFLISIAITRAIFSIPRFLKYQKAQTLLLIKIAEQQGVDENAIKRIIKVAEGGAFDNDAVPASKDTITYIHLNF